MYFRILNDIRTIEEILPDWHRLWLQQKPRFACTNPEWLFTWYRHFVADTQPLLLLAEQSGKILGIAPLMKLNRPFGQYSCGTLMFAAYHTVDYSEVLASDEEARHQLLEQVLVLEPDHPLVLQNLRSDSPSLMTLRNIEPCGHLSPTTLAPFIDLTVIQDPTSDRWISHNRRQLMRKRRRKAVSLGIQFENLGKLEGKELYFFSGQSAWLQASGLASRGLTSNFRDPRLTAFYIDLLETLTHQELLQVSRMVFDSRLIAFRVGMKVDGVLYDWLTAFDREYESISPGTLLLYEVIRGSITEGLREMDMMRGDESYKYHWTQQHRDVFAFSTEAR